jgi:pyruvate kinase
MKYLENKTKIVATIGPASADEATLRAMICEGLNVVRINFSHGSYEDHQKVIDNVRKLNDELGTHIALLADLQGPKIRTGEMEGGSVQLETGARLVISTQAIIGTSQRFSINYTSFAEEVVQGDFVLLDDGKLKLQVESTNGRDEVAARVIHGGTLSSKKGVNLPNTRIRIPSLTEKDRSDLIFALKNKISWIGLSFVRSPKDVVELKKLIADSGDDARVIAKIEKPEAVNELDKILEVSDGLMVARGDLGVEMPIEEIPITQKEIIRKCRNAAKPVIIATQMMESMIENFSPTRAEVTDVANAVLDGADAVMLSGETSVGKYPVEVIKAMYKIIFRMEQHQGMYYTPVTPLLVSERFISDAICNNAAQLAQITGSRAIITMTFSGYTAIKTAAFRPNSYVYVFTANRMILDTLALIWGTKSFYYDAFVSTDDTIADIKSMLKSMGYIRRGDYVINLASMPISDRGTTNMLRLSEVE